MASRETFKIPDNLICIKYSNTSNAKMGCTCISLSLFLGIVIAFIVVLVIITIIIAAAIIILAKANKEKPPSYKVKTQKEDDKE